MKCMAALICQVMLWVGNIRFSYSHALGQHLFDFVLVSHSHSEADLVSYQIRYIA